MIKNFWGSQANVPTKKWGNLVVESLKISDAVDGDLAVSFGSNIASKVPLVRIHSECVFAELLDSQLCDCKEQLDIALQELHESGYGYLFYIRIDGRGAGLSAKVKATKLEIEGIDTFDSRIQIGVSPDDREFEKVGEFLKKNGISEIILLTNNPDKIAGIEKLGIKVTPKALISTNQENENIQNLYKTKKEKFGHVINVGDS